MLNISYYVAFAIWDDVFHLVSCIPQNEMVVFAGDMNGHIGSSNVGYDGTHGGFGYGSRNADGSRILELAVTAETEEELIKRLNEWKDDV